MSGLFKGLLSPLIGVVPYNTMVFTVTEIFDEKLQETDLSRETIRLIAGGVAAGLGLVIYNPIELLKIKA